jgi:hypothetical protein
MYVASGSLFSVGEIGIAQNWYIYIVYTILYIKSLRIRTYFSVFGLISFSTDKVSLSVSFFLDSLFVRKPNTGTGVGRIIHTIVHAIDRPNVYGIMLLIPALSIIWPLINGKRATPPWPKLEIKFNIGRIAAQLPFSLTRRGIQLLLHASALAILDVRLKWR